MKSVSIILAFLIVQAEVPFKPADEFKVNVDLSFKKRQNSYEPDTFSASGDRMDKLNTTEFAFLTVIVREFKFQNDEVRLVAVNSNGKTLLKKKAVANLALRFEM